MEWYDFLHNIILLLILHKSVMVELSKNSLRDILYFILTHFDIKYKNLVNSFFDYFDTFMHKIMRWIRIRSCFSKRICNFAYCKLHNLRWIWKLHMCTHARAHARTRTHTCIFQIQLKFNRYKCLWMKCLW